MRPDSCQEKWFNQTLCRVNDCVVRLGVVEGEFHWHKHDNEDEFFYVVEGKLIIDLEQESLELGSDRRKQRLDSNITGPDPYIADSA